MLQIIRSHMLGVFAKILVGFISIAFAIFGIESYLVSGDRDNTVAKVNGEKITARDLTTTYNRLRNNTLSQYGKDFRITTEMQEQLRQEALQQLITRDIIYRAVSKQGFKISPYTVEAVVQNMPVFQQDGKFSPQVFNHVLMNMEYTPQSFFKDMSVTLTIAQLINGLNNTAFALPNEVEQAYLLAEQKRDFKYLTLSIEKAILATNVPEQEIADYYKNHTQNFQSDETVNVEYVELLADSIFASQTATDQEINDYYNNNLDNFSTPATSKEQPAKPIPFAEVKDKVKEALLKEKADQEFIAKSDQLAELAFTSPDSLQPIANAMKLPIQQSGSFTRNGNKEGLSASPKIINAAFSEAVLQQSANSEPVEVKSGQIVVIRIKEHNPAKTLPLATVHEKILAILKKEKATKAVKNEGQKLITELKNGKNPQEIAKSQNSQWNEKLSATRIDSDTDREIIRLAFSQSAPKNNHANFSGGALTSGDYVIVSVEKILPADKNKLTAEERSEYANQIKTARAAEETNFYVKALRDKSKIVMVKKE